MQRGRPRRSAVVEHLFTRPRQRRFLWTSSKTSQHRHQLRRTLKRVQPGNIGAEMLDSLPIASLRKRIEKRGIKLPTGIKKAQLVRIYKDNFHNTNEGGETTYNQPTPDASAGCRMFRPITGSAHGPKLLFLEISY